jgi:lipid A 4'-phosphatase
MVTDTVLLRLVGAGILLGIFFTIVPQGDLFVSSLFYGADGFALEHVAWLQSLRMVFWNITLLVPLALLLLILSGLFLPKVKAAVCLGPLLFLILGPGVIVNLILKAHWGRARPADVVEFGGDALFTTPFTIADQCLKNCSFVSGEAAGIVATSLVVFYLLANRLGPVGRRRLIWALGVISVIGSGLRVMMGRHFLSDVIFAALFMLVLFHVMRPLFRWLEAKGQRGWCLWRPSKPKV